MPLLAANPVNLADLDLRLKPDGTIHAIYNDALLPLMEQGRTETKRASHVEPAESGEGWTADLSPVHGPVLGPFPSRSEALAAEVAYLTAHVL